jgi:hypothetical protein
MRPVIRKNSIPHKKVAEFRILPAPRRSRRCTGEPGFFPMDGVFAEHRGYQRIVASGKAWACRSQRRRYALGCRLWGWGRRVRGGAITWREFVRAHRHSLLVVDFFTVETMWLQRLYVLFFIEFIELGSSRVHLAGCTTNLRAP